MSEEHEIVAPEGMRLVKCWYEQYRDAYMFQPVEWLVKHVDCYYLAREQYIEEHCKQNAKAIAAALAGPNQQEALAANKEQNESTLNVARFAGVLASIQAGYVRVFNVPALEGAWQLDELPAAVMGWLLLTVAGPLEATQTLPFDLPAVSANGGMTVRSRAKRKSRKR
jgi:hypothetical protein